ncbi:MAG: asparagine synthase (glutamine-hydrolyzing) [Phycisphaerales bacterium]|jgi:asparagine synthase (glutamine-hydrolysing)
MCGIVGVVTARGSIPSLTPSDVARMRDALAHRGPDDEGLEDLGNVLFGHRRLSVIDPTPAGHQPFFSPDRRFVMVYNGELYNDAELRRELAESYGVSFKTSCDTETVLHAVAAWGTGAAAKMRGMYAFALLDTLEHRLVLARDPLGIKPLYVHTRAAGATGGQELTFASEPTAILQHPQIRFEPDWPALSAYLTTIRTVTGARTLFKGIESLRPGEWRTYDLTNAGLAHETHDAGSAMSWPVPEGTLTEAVEASVEAHLRSDVPMCSLLSGGLDSSIIAACTMAKVGSLNTYCSGATTDDPAEDFQYARQMAKALGTNHTEAVVSREMFAQRWPDMVRRQGVPMSTPNEVAINEVCRKLRAQGHVVTLSGEGADELFGGYGPPLQVIHDHCAKLRTPIDPDGGTFQLRSQQWVPLETKGLVLNPAISGQIQDDALVVQGYQREFARMVDAGPNDHPMQAHLRFQRRINLVNLLQRLDTASMLESVEGRTPFADPVIAAMAEQLPLVSKFHPAADRKSLPGTKLVLREAFADRLPAEVVLRPKASFPLPFIPWMPDHVSILDRPAARELFSGLAVQTVKDNPVREWPLAWPMLNAILWYERWAG